jgi:hypothetical protein
MKSLRPLIVLVIVCAFYSSVAADVPPDPGYKRITLNLVVEPADDFADYRFFLKSGFDLKEYTLKKGEKITLSPMGGGALYRNGKFLAVPKKALVGLSEERSDQKLNPMQKAIAEGVVPGTISLIEHGFIRDVRSTEASSLKDPNYRVEKDPEVGIKAVLVSGGVDETKTSGNSGSFYSTDPQSPAFWMTVAAGLLLTFAFIFFGAWIARKKKSVSSAIGSQL